MADVLSGRKLNATWQGSIRMAFHFARPVDVGTFKTSARDEVEGIPAGAAKNSYVVESATPDVIIITRAIR